MSQLRSISDDALIDAYYQAADVEGLIDRLAVDNRTTRRQVRAALAALGCMPAEEAPKRPRGPASKIDAAKAQALYEKGWSDMKIAKALGMSHNAVYNWRKRHGLPSHTQIMEKENGHLLPREPTGTAALDGCVAPERTPDPRRQPEPEANEPPLTLGEFRSVLTAYLPAALNDAELYLDGVPLLSVPRIVTSWGDGVLRVDVQTRRGG